jgi:hypothetical protein
LESEIVLLTEEPGHATIIILEWADWGALHVHPVNVEPPLLKHLLQALWHTCLGCHFLWFSMALDTGIIYGDHSVLLLSLFPPIALIHIKCTKGIWPEQSVRGRMVEQEKRDALGVRLLEDCDHVVHLHEELRMIPPRVTTCSRIRNAPGVFHHDTLLIADDKTSILFLDEI